MLVTCFLYSWNYLPFVLFIKLRFVSSSKTVPDLYTGSAVLDGAVREYYFKRWPLAEQSRQEPFRSRPQSHWQIGVLAVHRVAALVFVVEDLGRAQEFGDVRDDGRRIGRPVTRVVDGGQAPL